MAQKTRNGKYVEYEKAILNRLAEKPNILQSTLRTELSIPKTSFYQVILKLKKEGKIKDIYYKRNLLTKISSDVNDADLSMKKFIAKSINRKNRNLKIKLKNPFSITSISSAILGD